MAKLTINLDNTKEISPILYGIFFEDINRAADGGLYGELIANNSFEYFYSEDECDMHFVDWEKFDAKVKIKKRGGFSRVNPHYAEIIAKEGGGIRNLGFGGDGIGVHAGRRYKLSFYARSNEETVLSFRLSENGICFCEASEVIDTPDWTKHTLEMESSATKAHAQFEVVLPFGGTVQLDAISLFPADTYKKRKNGLRADIAEMIAQLHPKFMRFPGGCIVEGRSFDTMYNWKDTLGPVEERKINKNRWQLDEYQMPGNRAQDYFQSYGLGYYEYFLFCEDIGAEPVPVMNCGMTCQWHEGLLVPLDELEPYIQDVLDLIEFANGDVSTKWGGYRSELGHPKPFSLKYIGIGNEQWGTEYFERYEIFAKRINAVYPEIRLITSAGWDSEGKDFDLAVRWMEKNKEKAFAVDEHFYKSPEWFLSNIHRYDDYDRTMPKVFAGEYACHNAEKKEDKTNNYYAALCEAAFMTGMENNADHVWMSCYAPLLAKVGAQQWQPDLIWFDNRSVYGTPSYYVQKLFSRNYGNLLIEANCDEKDIFVSVTMDNESLYIKIVNISDEEKVLELETLGGRIDDNASVAVMSAGLDEENSLDNPYNVVPLYRDKHLETGDKIVIGGHGIKIIRI